jgi:hypothetical protein
MDKSSKAYSIANMKCPRCHEGDYFLGKNPYSLNGLKMVDNCPCCQLKYDMEPGFYLGAMYISYAMGVAFTIPSVVALLLLLPDFPIHYYLIFGLLELSALMPIMYRYSRIIWINFFVAFEKGKSE